MNIMDDKDSNIRQRGSYFSFWTWRMFTLWTLMNKLGTSVAAAVVKGHPLQARIGRVVGVGNELLWESVEAFADGINIWRAGDLWQQNVIRTLAIFLHRDASRGQPDHAAIGSSILMVSLSDPRL
jgi:hypothetical protein